MSTREGSGTVGGKVEELVRRLEDSWLAGAPLAIEVLLGDVDSEVRQAATPRLLAIEAANRGRTDSTITSDEFRKRFVEAETDVDRLVTDTIELTAALPRPSNEQTTAAATRYVNLRYFKAGGLGELYRAQDQALERDVALKFLGESVRHNGFLRQKFEVEAIVTGGLDHPGVVPVYGLGETWDGRPFYAMRFVEGDELQVEIDHLHRDGFSRLGLHRLIGSLVAVCRTVAYAHSRGVIHRDIKPENVKIGRFGETILLDWGLAQTIQRDAGSKATGLPSLVQGERKASTGSDGGAGTIGYMSPEQLGDLPATPSPATDIYSLGATLYHILTGRPSIVGSNCTLTRTRIAAGDFPGPRKIRSDVPKALEAICLKAVARDAVDRYPSAAGMADDLEAWMADETVSVYREPRLEQVMRGLRRHRGVAASLAGSALLFIFGLVAFAGFAGNKAEQERLDKVEAQAAHHRADAALQTAEIARAEGMHVAARLAARAVAADVELRWRILENRAADPELRGLLADAAGESVGSPKQQALQAWVEKTRDGESIGTASWCIYDATGVQLARDSDDRDRKSVGKSFRYRDYFHGQGLDLAPNSPEADSAKPIRDVYRSATYVSTAAREKNLTVAFSAPIWNDADQVGDPIGVIMMSVSVGDFRVLLDDMNVGQTATLIDVRDDRIDDVVRSGLVLHHHKLENPARRRVSEADLAKFRELQRAVLADRELSAKDGYRTDYVDPVANPDGRPVRAAVVPILIRTRQGKASNSEWVVVVHDLVGAAGARP